MTNKLGDSSIHSITPTAQVAMRPMDYSLVQVSTLTGIYFTYMKAVYSVILCVR